MEKIKWQIRDHLLSLSPQPIQQYDCLKKMLDVEAEARSYYAEVIDMESHEFAEMLLLDGCFIIQLFRRRPEPEAFNKVTNHLLADNIWIQTRLVQDFVLLENEIPFFIFKSLLEVLNIPQLPNFLELQRIILSRFNIILPNLKVPPLPQPDQEVAHLLHLLHQSILGIPRKKSNATPSGPQSVEVSSLPEPNQDSKPHIFLHDLLHKRILRIPWKKEVNASPSDSQFPKKSLFVVPSATELVEAGIKIGAKEAGNFLEISFDKGVLHVPAIQVDDYTNLVFRNLIALEQFRNDVGMDITCYFSFMDSIINTELRDVALLSRKEIIYNGLGSDKDIASIFNELCKGVTFVIGRNYLAPLSQNVHAYYNSRCNRWRAKLMHDYFSNPWAIISVIAATFLLILTVVQTLFSVLSYSQQIHSIDRLRL